jgi:predicted ArsR family transcriptional regulator
VRRRASGLEGICKLSSLEAQSEIEEKNAACLSQRGCPHVLIAKTTFKSLCDRSQNVFSNLGAGDLQFW